MIDLNTLVSNALIAAVQQAVAPLNERIATLEGICATQHEAMVAMRDRIAALENNPAQGVDTTLMQRIEALEDKAVTASLRSGLTRDEVEALIERTMDNHCETYDHDNYDEIASKVDDADFDDFVTNDNLEDAVREAVGNLSFDISVS